MIWLDGSEINIKQFSGEGLCEKIGSEMYGNDNKNWFKCADFIQNAILIIDFDTVINMEGFPTPHYGYFSNDYYMRIIKAFQTIGDVEDAEILAKAGEIDSEYQKLLDNTDNKDKRNKLYDEFSEKLDLLEQKLYLHTDFPIWEMLYAYLDDEIKKL